MKYLETEAGPASSAKQHAYVKKQSIENLGQGKHSDSLIRALSNILSTDTAERAYGQIIDGAPLRQILRKHPGFGFPEYEHSELCPGVLTKLRQIHDAFDINSLQFDSQVLRPNVPDWTCSLLICHTQLLHKFRAAAPGSRAFKAALMELVARTVHQIAAYLYKLDLDLGKHKNIALRNGLGPLHTLFYHKQYQAFDQYPDGVANIVGYWAEAEIFGGVVLFDRRKADEREPRENVRPFSPCLAHESVPFVIWIL